MIFQRTSRIGHFSNTGRLVQKFLPKHTDVDKILKVNQRKILKSMHLPVTIKEI